MAEIVNKNYLDLTGLTTYDTEIKKKIAADDASTLASAKSYADGLGVNYDPAGTAQTKVDALANGAVKTNSTEISTLKTNVGNVGDLSTTAKDLVGAVEEVKRSVSSGGTAAVVTIDTSTTSEGAVKSYTIKQGSNTVGTIDIPKDMVVESGEVVKDPAGQAKGTYIKLVLANVTDPLYINVGTLVDIYKAKASATQVQVAIDSATREISATIIAGSIGATELGTNSVVTAKIADANVTKTKLAADVQASLGKADAAASQESLDAEIERARGAEVKALTDAKAYTDTKKTTVITGTANGTVKVDGTDVPVKGLGTAAYTASSAYDAAGTAASAVSTLERGQVTTNKNNIAALTTKVESLESNVIGSIAEQEIKALFA